GAGRLGAARLRARPAAALPGAAGARAFHAARAAGGIHGPRREAEARRRDYLPQAARDAGLESHRFGRYGRLQHLLRADLARRAVAARAPPRATPPSPLPRLL